MEWCFQAAFATDVSREWSAQQQECIWKGYVHLLGLLQKRFSYKEERQSRKHFDVYQAGEILIANAGDSIQRRGVEEDFVGRLATAVCADENRVHVEVWDNGMGIDASIDSGCFSEWLPEHDGHTPAPESRENESRLAYLCRIVADFEGCFFYQKRVRKGAVFGYEVPLASILCEK